MVLGLRYVYEELVSCKKKTHTELLPWRTCIQIKFVHGAQLAQATLSSKTSTSSVTCKGTIGLKRSRLINPCTGHTGASVVALRYSIPSFCAMSVLKVASFKPISKTS